MNKIKGAQSKKAEAAPESGRLIYCGPNIPGGALQRYTVFKGGIPVHLGSILKKYPAAVKLFVSVTDLARVDRAVATKGTPEHSAYMEVLQYTTKGGV